MKALIDTNIVLDVFLNRKPFVDASARIFGLIEQSRVEGVLCATTITTIEYLLSQALSGPEARELLWKLLVLFEIAPVNRPVIERALRSRINDFEDAVLEEAGQVAGAGMIVTRNLKDFKYARLKVFDPIQFLALQQK